MSKRFFVNDDNSCKEEKDGMINKDGLYIPKELADKKEEVLKKDGDK